MRMFDRSSKAIRALVVVLAACVASLSAAAALSAAHDSATATANPGVELLAAFPDELAPVRDLPRTHHTYYEVYANGALVTRSWNGRPGKVRGRSRVSPTAAWGVVTLASSLDGWAREHFISKLAANDRYNYRGFVSIRGALALPPLTSNCDFMRPTGRSTDPDFDEVEGMLQAITHARLSCLHQNRPGRGHSWLSFGIEPSAGQRGMIVTISPAGAVSLARLYCRVIDNYCIPSEKPWVGATPSGFGPRVYPGVMSAVKRLLSTVVSRRGRVYPGTPQRRLFVAEGKGHAAPGFAIPLGAHCPFGE